MENVPRFEVIKTIALNRLELGVIKRKALASTLLQLAHCTNRELLVELVESHRLDPRNLSQHEILLVNEN